MKECSGHELLPLTGRPQWLLLSTVNICRWHICSHILCNVTRQRPRRRHTEGWSGRDTCYIVPGNRCLKRGRPACNKLRDRCLRREGEGSATCAREERALSLRTVKDCQVKYLQKYKNKREEHKAQSKRFPSKQIGLNISSIHR